MGILFDIIRGLVLGAVQGLAEFFPISSSGHLILVPVLLRWPDQGLAFDTVLHLGTLVALLWFFRNDIIDLYRRKAWNFLLKVVVATLPALVIAFFANDWIEANVRQGWIVAFDLALFGLILFGADRWSEKKKGRLDAYESVSWGQALAVGFAQPLAIIPGTSRSGITITAGLLAGLTRQAAARFSFFLSIPITAAAGLHGLLEVAGEGIASDQAVSLMVGFLSALGFGLFAIRFLVSYVAKHRYDGFVIYRLILALVVLALA
jgi:undecaprenyl-diphosphatase